MDNIIGFPKFIIFNTAIGDTDQSDFIVGGAFDGKALITKENIEGYDAFLNTINPCNNFWMHITPKDGYLENGSYLDLKFCNHDAEYAASTLTFNEKFGGVTQYASFGNSYKEKGARDWGIVLYAYEGEDIYESYLLPWQNYFKVGNSNSGAGAETNIEWGGAIFNIYNSLNGSDYKIIKSNANDATIYIENQETENNYALLGMQGNKMVLNLHVFDDAYYVDLDTDGIFWHWNYDEQQTYLDVKEASFYMGHANGGYFEWFIDNGYLKLSNISKQFYIDLTSSEISLYDGSKHVSFFSDNAYGELIDGNKKIILDGGGGVIGLYDSNSSVNIDLADLGSKTMYIRELQVCEGNETKKIKVLATDSY